MLVDDITSFVLWWLVKFQLGNTAAKCDVRDMVDPFGCVLACEYFVVWEDDPMFSFSSTML
jgi:hypothetical protein